MSSEKGRQIPKKAASNYRNSILEQIKELSLEQKEFYGNDFNATFRNPTILPYFWEAFHSQARRGAAPWGGSTVCYQQAAPAHTGADGQPAPAPPKARVPGGTGVFWSVLQVSRLASDISPLAVCF